jgi:flagellar basal-body rod modification protein FlgD
MPTQVNMPDSILTATQYEQQLQEKKYSTEDALGRDAFLKLFTTQLTNQNPLEPMDNEAFVSQLAQFSSLESMKAMQAGMDNVAAAINNQKFVTGSNLLGKNIPNDIGYVTAGGGVGSTAYSMLTAPADSITVRVLDMSNKEIYTKTYSNPESGPLSINWPGIDNDGDQVPLGAYKVMATVTNGGVGKALTVTGLERIRSVRWDAELKDYSVITESGRELSSDEINNLEI